MSSELGFFLGVILVIVGIVTYWLAPRIGPNPWFGLRTGYSVASREVWNKTNRLGGLLAAACGLVELILVAVVVLFGADSATARNVYLGWLIVGGGAAIGWSFLYSRQLANQTATARELKPIAFNWAYVLPVLASGVVLLAVALYFLPQLPADHIATHFDINGVANGWMDRTGFLLTFLGLAGLFTLMDVATVLWATKEPLIAVDRLGSSLWLSPQRGLLFMAGLFTFLNLFFAFLLGDTVAYTLTGSHIIASGMLIWSVLPILVVVVLGFFALAQRREFKELVRPVLER